MDFILDRCLCSVDFVGRDYLVCRQAGKTDLATSQQIQLALQADLDPFLHSIWTECPAAGIGLEFLDVP